MQLIKSTALVLGFLFAISTAYYLSFWSHFDVDALQYMAVEDIIKGVAYPLRFMGLWLAGLIVLAVVTLATIDILTSSLPIKYSKISLGVFMGYTLLVGIFYTLTYFNKIQADKDITSIGSSFLFSFFFAFIYWLTDKKYDQEKTAASQAQQTYSKIHPAVSISNKLVIFLFIFLPISAIIAGQTDAKKILNKEQYDYVMASDLPKDSVRLAPPYLLFLGAAGEKYIFADTAQSERLIIDKEELKTVRIHHFDQNDSSSKIRRKNYLLSERRLAKLSNPKQKPVTVGAADRYDKRSESRLLSDTTRARHSNGATAK